MWDKAIVSASCQSSLMVLLASSASFDVEHSIENMAKLINPDGCLICAHIDGSIVSVLLAVSALIDVNHLVKNMV